MTLYEIIYDFLLTMFPSAPNSMCLAFVDLASIVSMALIYVVLVNLIIFTFKIVCGAFKW